MNGRKVQMLCMRSHVRLCTMQIFSCAEVKRVFFRDPPVCVEHQRSRPLHLWGPFDAALSAYSILTQMPPLWLEHRKFSRDHRVTTTARLRVRGSGVRISFLSLMNQDGVKR